LYYEGWDLIPLRDDDWPLVALDLLLVDHRARRPS